MYRDQDAILRHTRGNRVFISGAISSDPDYMSKFQAAEWRVVNAGFQAVNPTKLPHDHDHRWSAYMKECIDALLECDYIYQIEANSPGSIVEQQWAIGVGIPCINI